MTRRTAVTPEARAGRRPASAGYAAGLLVTALLGACAGPGAEDPHPPPLVTGPASAAPTPATVLARLTPLGQPAVLLIGEQHDAPAHQVWHRAVVRTLADRGQLAALVLEMAESGADTTGLLPDADETRVRRALRWDDEAWPWAAYGPAVMAAVTAGVPVLGGNLPRDQLRLAMKSRALDDHLTLASRQELSEKLREGHCGLLPEDRVWPLARVQLARDASMAATVRAALQPGRTVVLLAGEVHTDRVLGVPGHLPPGLALRSVRLQAGDTADGTRADRADAVWHTPAAPATDHCAGLRRQWPAPGRPAPAQTPAGS